jgi:hypothetical protein
MADGLGILTAPATAPICLLVVAEDMAAAANKCQGGLTAREREGERSKGVSEEICMR